MDEKEGRVLSKKSILLNEKIEEIINLTGVSAKVSVCSVKDALEKIVAQDKNAQFEIIFKENDYKKYSTEFFSCLKILDANYSTLIVGKNCKSFYSSKTLSSISKKICIVVGDDDFIKASNIFCSLKKVKCYAFLTTPYFTELLKDEYTYVDMGKLINKKVKPIEYLFINESIIKRSSVYQTLSAYSYNVLQSITLIDYKFSSLLVGKIADDKYYKLLKQGLNYALSFSSYDCPSNVLTLSSFIVNAVDAKSDIIKNSTANNFIKVIRLLSDDCPLPKLYFTGFEKLLKLYHFFFTNDLNDVLLYPDYVNDIEKLSLIIIKEQEEIYKNLKIPSAKRVELINKLLKKVGPTFLNETTAFLKMLPKIEKAFYLELYKEIKRSDIDVDDIKNALRLSTYLTPSQNVLVVMRDLGLLN